jgi:preprotein translocase subunit SecE
MFKKSPIQFMREVRQELNKLTWPTRRETITTSIMVVVMAVISSLFFLFLDTLISTFVNLFLKIGS